MNRLYTKFCSRNPSFLERNGKISIVAHSLGSVIAYDILTLWDIELRHRSQDATKGTGFLTESLQYLRSVTSQTSFEQTEPGPEGKRKDNLRVELAKARSEVMRLEAVIVSEVEHEKHGAGKSLDECPFALRFKVRDGFDSLKYAVFFNASNLLISGTNLVHTFRWKTYSVWDHRWQYSWHYEGSDLRMTWKITCYRSLFVSVS